MATSNLISTSLGDINIQSGNGTPNHESSISTIYYDNNTGLIWENTNGFTSSWAPLTPVIYGELDVDTNTTLSTPNGVNVYISLSGLTWTNNNYNLKGFTVNGNKLVLNNGLSGVYRIIGNLGVLRNATTNGYFVGVSINGQNPTALARSATGTDVNKTSGHATVIFDSYLNGGDSVEMTIAPTISGAGTFYVRNANLIIYRLY